MLLGHRLALQNIKYQFVRSRHPAKRILPAGEFERKGMVFSITLLEPHTPTVAKEIEPSRVA